MMRMGVGRDACVWWRKSDVCVAVEALDLRRLRMEECGRMWPVEADNVGSLSIIYNKKIIHSPSRAYTSPAFGNGGAALLGAGSDTSTASILPSTLSSS